MPVNHTYTSCFDYAVSLEQFITLPHSQLNNTIHILQNLLTYLLTHSMEWSPSLEPNRFSAGQEIPHILWNLKIHYRIYKSLPPVPILSQLYAVHTPLPEDPSKYYPPTFTWASQVASFPEVYPTKSSVRLTSLHARYLPCPSHSSRFFHQQNIK